MARRRIPFTEPFWEFLLPFLSFLVFLPLLFADFKAFFFLTEYGDHMFGSSFENTSLKIYLFLSCGVALNTWALNRLLNVHDLMVKTNFLPALFTLFFLVINVYFLGAGESLFATFLALISIHYLLDSLDNEKSFAPVYNSGLGAGTALLFDLNAIYLVVFGLLTILITYHKKLRGFVIYMVAQMNVAILFFGVQYLIVGNFTNSYALIENISFGFHKISSSIQWLLVGSISTITLLGLASIIHLLRNRSNRSTLKVRILVLGLVWMALCAFSFDISQIGTLTFSVVALCTAIFSTYTFSASLNKYSNYIFFFIILFLASLLFIFHFM